MPYHRETPAFHTSLAGPHRTRSIAAQGRDPGLGEGSPKWSLTFDLAAFGLYLTGTIFKQLLRALRTYIPDGHVTRYCHFIGSSYSVYTGPRPRGQAVVSNLVSSPDPTPKRRKGSGTHSLVPRPHPKKGERGLVNLDSFLGLAGSVGARRHYGSETNLESDWSLPRLRAGR